jgi:hypothetical protein
MQTIPMTPPVQPNLFVRLWNWLTGKTTSSDQTIMQDAPTEPAEESYLPQETIESTEGDRVYQKAYAVLKKDEPSELSLLKTTDYSARGYEEGKTFGDRHFLELSITEICSKMESALQDGIQKRTTEMRQLEEAVAQHVREGLLEFAEECNPQIMAIQDQIHVLEQQKVLVKKGAGWAQFPVETYKSGFNRARIEATEQLIANINRPIL